MTTVEMRRLLLSAYSTASWRNTVENASAPQIFALYTRLKKAGTIK